MSKSKLLKQIENDLGLFQAHIKKINQTNRRMNRIDIDLFRKKTLDIYEHIELLEDQLPERMEKHLRTHNLPEKTPKAELPTQSKGHNTSESIKETASAVEENPTLVQEEENDTKQNIETKEKEVIKEKNNIQSSKTIIETSDTDTVEHDQDEKHKIKEKPLIKTENEIPMPEQPKEMDDKPKTTLDLFAENAESTIADQLQSDDDESIANKMQKSQVVDLRKVIGINEKFLFINELFNGDMSRYNKAIDDLNGFTTQSGVDTYLIELKIANQWADRNEAYLKLKALLNRKIG